MEIIVMRIGHRKVRDQRITTHVALVARALGAQRIIVCGDRDEGLVRSVKKVVGNWGGKFEITQTNSWRKELQNLKKKGYCAVHLTMYGEGIEKEITSIRAKNKCVVLVGSRKVPPEAYRDADYNISVTNQPHSEIASLAIFLDRVFGGKELAKKWDGKHKIVPSKFGKNVIMCSKKTQV